MHNSALLEAPSVGCVGNFIYLHSLARASRFVAIVPLAGEIIHSLAFVLTTHDQSILHDDGAYCSTVHKSALLEAHSVGCVGNFIYIHSLACAS